MGLALTTEPAEKTCSPFMIEQEDRVLVVLWGGSPLLLKT